MATGDQNDIAQRLSSYLPTRWFGTILDTLLLAFINAVLQGTTACLSFLYSLYAYAKLQARIATATDGWLDLISADFFGNTLPRIPGEIDNSYRARIRARLVQEKATRSAISQAVQQLTGYAPQIFEPWLAGFARTVFYHCLSAACSRRHCQRHGLWHSGGRLQHAIADRLHFAR
jgi:ABC-type nickel/cobalt efflux system permease component RcnA